MATTSILRTNRSFLATNRINTGRPPVDLGLLCESTRYNQRFALSFLATYYTSGQTCVIDKVICVVVKVKPLHTTNHLVISTQDDPAGLEQVTLL